jgi:DNA-binding MarR family transcriptional regulator
MPGKPASQRALAAAVWRMIFEFLMRTRPQRDQVLADFGLTPNDMRALSALDAEEGRSMRSLAELWGCDASNATWIVDRLERLGLAERRTTPEDRRVKLVVLTRRGARNKRDVLARMYEPPPELLELDAATLRALRRALSKLPRPSSSWSD